MDRQRLLWPAVLMLALMIASVTLRRQAEWYRLVYRAFYVLRLRIWERSEPASDLVALVEGPSALPPGRALDLGCGTATDSIYLAQHGWEITGVDMVPEALDVARRRAAKAGVAPKFVQGGVTHLKELGVQGDYTLLLDFGCLHTLPAAQRDAYVKSISAVAAPGATFLLYGFARPPKLAPMQAGLTSAEVHQRFDHAGWKIVSEACVSDDAINVGRIRADRSFELWRYRLQRQTA
jgi:SAM-dependent methyltransferase